MNDARQEGEFQVLQKGLQEGNIKICFFFYICVGDALSRHCFFFPLFTNMDIEFLFFSLKAPGAQRKMGVCVIEKEN